MTEEDILALLALQHTPNIGDITAKKLIAHCGSPAAIYKEKKHKIAHIERRKHYPTTPFRPYTPRSCQKGMAIYSG